ncbi:Hypothetical protein A7982_11435 [Minicystis rosea]|nr:Hypothetical protein A7982_11435 [Minicystis rosea]
MNPRSQISVLLSALALGFLACSSTPEEHGSTSAGGGGASSSGSADTSSSGASTGGGGGGLPQAKHVVYLNFNGTVWTAGPDDAPARTSGILAFGNQPKTVISGFAAAIGPHPDSALRQAIITKTTALVVATLAPFDVSVTTRRPTVPFTEVVIGGSPDDVGAPSFAAGVAAGLDCDDANPANTALVFADSGALLIPVDADGAATVLASTALHELGHTWGLAHTDDVADIMNPNNSASLKWGSGAVVGGTDTVETCGRATQDSGALLMMHLGPHVERAEVPVVPAGKGPVVVGSTPVDAPEPGLATGTKLLPCLKLASSSNVLGAFAETWVQSSRWVRLSRGAQMGSASSVFQFDPVDTPPGLPMFERLAVIDAADDVTEVRAWLLPSGGGPVLPSCN